MYAGLLCVLASGCVSLDGMQKSVVKPATAISVYDAYLNKDVITPFYDASKRNGLSNTDWRNAVIAARIAAADARYGVFVRKLNGERNTFTLGATLISLGLTGGASIAAQTTANALSAAATGVTGAGTAVNKELFAQQTVQVLVTQMDANRATVFARLVAGERKSAADYPIGDAMSDLADYESAGSLQRALGKVATAADNAKQTADTAVKRAAINGTVVAQDVEVRKAKLAAFVKSLATTDTPENETTLKGIVGALSLTATDKPEDEKNEILPALDVRIKTSTDADTVYQTLKDFLPEGF